MAPGDDLLELASRDGSIDFAEWPRLLEQLLPRLDDIVQTEFPTPTIPVLEPLELPFTENVRPLRDQSPSPRKEDAEPQTPPLPSSGLQRSSAGHNATPSSSTMISNPAGKLPGPLLILYDSILSTLQGPFAKCPPYTIQRLAELILYPTRHYRTLPSYLRALERVVSVTSTAAVYPLPIPEEAQNGDESSYLYQSRHRLDEMNGAELTRIPWLRDSVMTTRPHGTDLRTESTSVIDGPNGAGSMETVTVSVNGHVDSPASHSNTVGGTLSSSHLNPAPAVTGAAPRMEDEADEEPVHARGPQEIGNEDIGPQRGSDRVFDAEAALGRPGEGQRIVSEPEPHIGEPDTLTQRDPDDGEGEFMTQRDPDTDTDLDMEMMLDEEIRPAEEGRAERGDTPPSAGSAALAAF